MDRNLDEEVFGPNHTHPAQSGEDASGSVLAARKQKTYITGGKPENLRGLIQGTVASMISRKLLGQGDPGLERTLFLDNVLSEFRNLVLRPGTRMAMLRDFLETRLPPNRPDLEKVLFIEAVARRLGEEWEADTCDMVDVAIASARLQEFIHFLGGEFGGSFPLSPQPMAVILVPFGEQHTLMPHLLGLLFDSLGWSRRVLEADKVRTPALGAALAHASIACIGWSNIRLAREMQELVSSIRMQGGNRKLPIMAGGAAALGSIDYLVDMGIDCICDSIYAAARVCERYHDLTMNHKHVRSAGPPAADKHSQYEWRAQ